METGLDDFFHPQRAGADRPAYAGNVTVTQFEVAVFVPSSARTAKECVEPGLRPVILSVVNRLVVPPARVSRIPSRS